MSTEVWGQMPKSQSDGEKVEEAISRMIAEHEGDPEAHLGAGESIEVHRTQTAVDHPAGSIAVDKFSRARILQTSFESIDGWSQYTSGLSEILLDFGSVTLKTGATSGNYAGLAAVSSGLVSFKAGKDCFWRSTLRLAQTTSQKFYFGVGYLVDLVDFNGFGFKVVNGSLYAYMGDFTHYVETAITGVVLTTLHTYEIHYHAAQNLVEFWIDGILVASFDSGYFPEDSDEASAFLLETNAAAAKYAYIFNMMYQQDY